VLLSLDTRALLLALRVRAPRLNPRTPSRAGPLTRRGAARPQDEARARQRTLETSAELPATRDQIAQLASLRAFLPVRLAALRLRHAPRRGVRPRAPRARPDATCRAVPTRAQPLGQYPAETASDAAPRPGASASVAAPRARARAL
jgi:hypothetical protein